MKKNALKVINEILGKDFDDDPTETAFMIEGISMKPD